MDNVKLKKEINNILSKYGFKKKGNRWTRNGEKISEKVVLQKSLYGNYYYFRYYYVINNLPLEDDEGHVLTSIGVSEQKYKLLSEAFDLENALDDEQRIEIMNKVLSESILSKDNPIDSEEKMKAFLMEENLPVLRIVTQYLCL
jgi:hypothetical protein